MIGDLVAVDEALAATPFLLALIAGGSLFGFFGMLIAVPTAAAIQVFARHWIELYQSSRLYQAPDRDPVSEPPAAGE